VRQGWHDQAARVAPLLTSPVSGRAGRAGLQWALIQQLGGQAVAYGSFLVLAGLLQPGDIGVVGMASVWVAFLAAFAEAGLGAALIHRRELRAEHLSTTFVVNLGVGLLLTVAGALLAWPAAQLFRTPSVAPVMAALSIGFLLRSLSLTHVALAQRELDFRALAIRDIAANLAGGVLGVGLALRGWGVWSLVGMTLTTATAATLLLWRLTPWRPRRVELSRAAAAELWPYGSRILGFNLLKALTQNADRLVVGIALGSHAVGIYTLAARLVLQPATMLAGAFGTYLFPRISQLQGDPAAVRSVYRRGVGAILVLLVPTMLLVSLLGRPVLLLLGAEWLPAVPVVQILAVAALLQAVFSPAGQLMKGHGRPGWLLVWSAGFSVLTLAAIGAGAVHGVAGAAAGYAAAHLIALPVILAVSRRLAGFGGADLVRAMLPVAVGGGALAACLLAARHAAAGWGPPALVAGALAGIAIYIATVAWLSPELAAEWRARRLAYSPPRAGPERRRAQP
jgi:O-antigen/teichoic acid export membrane protein